MNPDKLKQLQQNVRIGGKGTARRKFKAPKRNAAVDDKKVQATLKRLGVNPISDIQEVNLFKDDGTIIHFSNPKVQAQPQANTFVVSGKGENKKIEELLPSILFQLGRENLIKYQHLLGAGLGLGAGGAGAAGKTEDEDIPDLVENFDAKAKTEEKKEEKKEGPKEEKKEEK